MAITLNDNDGIVNYTLSLVNTDGKRLITEGTARKATVIDSSSISLSGVSIDQRLEVIDTPDQVDSESNEPIDADPEPQAPTKPRVAPAEGTNPYVDSTVFLDDQRFKTEYRDEYYELGRDGVLDKIILTVRDENDDMASIYLADEERIKMAIRLLSVTPDALLVSDGVNIFEPAEDVHSPKSIGAAIFALHAMLKGEEHEKALEAHRTEHEAWKARQTEKSVGKNEAEALHELVVRRFIERDPASEDFIRSVDANKNVESRWPLSYSDYQQRILDRLTCDGLTAVQQLAKVLGELPQSDPEEDALDAITLRNLNGRRGRHLAYELAEAKRAFTITFPKGTQQTREELKKLDVTAVQYAKAHGIEYPAK